MLLIGINFLANEEAITLLRFGSFCHSIHGHITRLLRDRFSSLGSFPFCEIWYRLKFYKILKAEEFKADG